MTVIKGTVPKGQPLFAFVQGDSLKVTTKTGYSYYWQSNVLKPTGNVLGAISYKMALPKGKTLREVSTVVLTVPPGGSAPLVASGVCAESGLASVALQSVTGGRDIARLASQAIAVAQYLLTKNAKLKFVFSGFSMGGFGAQAAAIHMTDHCAGLLLIGNYYKNPPLLGQRPIVMLVGNQDFHLSFARKALQEQADLGADIRLIAMAGGHGYGSNKAQGDALRHLISRNSLKTGCIQTGCQQRCATARASIVLSAVSRNSISNYQPVSCFTSTVFCKD